jgi:2-oxoisovalerate ferredoxin oxidoreductase beta subunit
MTGGQFAPTTLLGQKSSTCPEGRDAINEGYPLHVSELLATLEAPVYIERVALGDNKQIAGAARAIRKGVENQVRGLGFSLIEVLTPCTTIWKMTPVDAQRWVKETMEKTFPLGVFRDRTKQTQPRLAAKPAPALEELRRILEIESDDAKAGGVVGAVARNVDLRVRVAGFGGQGVLLLGEVLAEAGLDAGLEVSWLPSYGPEMRSGTSNCQVRIASELIDSPLVPVPNILIAMNEPSLRKFYGSVSPGGWVIYNGDAFPEDCKRADVHVLALPFSQMANELGDPRMANIIMLGALLEIAQNLPQASIDAALRRLVKKPKLVELGQHALERGRELFRASLATAEV